MKRNNKSKINFNFISLILAQVLVFSSIKYDYENLNNKLDELILNKELNVIQSTELDAEKISFLINNNENLSEEEKVFLYNTHIIVLENSDYIIKNQIENFLSSVNFNYNYEREGVLGDYSILTHEINVIFPDMDSAYCTLLHEVLHGYSNSVEDHSSSRYLSEIYNEICTKEYCEELGITETKTGYDEDLVIGYILEKIVGTEIIKAYKFNSDLTLITNELLNIGVNQNDIDGFYNDMDSLNYCKLYKPSDRELLFNIYESVNNYLEIFYSTKFDMSMTDSLEMLFLLNGSHFDNYFVQYKLFEYSYYSKDYISEYNLYTEFVGREVPLSYDMINKEIFNNTEDLSENKYFVNEVEKKVDDKLSKNYSVMSLLNLYENNIEKNAKLSQREVFAVKSTIDFLEHYMDQFDMNKILEISSNLNIVYNAEFNGSYYDNLTSTLYLTESSSNVSLEKLYSEILQIYTNNYDNCNEYIYNLVNDLFKSEYQTNILNSTYIDETYKYDMIVAYFLYELLGEEMLYEYKFNPSNSVLHSLLEIKGMTPKEIYKFLSILENISIAKNAEDESLNMEKAMYEFYKFTTELSNGDFLINNELKYDLEIVNANINFNYFIDDENQMLIQNEIVYLQDTINVFNQYSNAEKSFISVKVRK